MSRTEDLASGYDALYGEPHIAADADTPLMVLEDLRYHGANGRALDVGCGHGRNSLQLARAGFKVTAIDLSAVGIAKLRDSALTAGLDIETIVGDAETHAFTCCYDVIVAAYVLHHLRKTSALELIRRLQAHTVVGGVHAIAVFNKDSSFERLDPESGGFYPASDEIEDLYSGWNIVAHVDQHESALPHADADAVDYSIFLARKMNGPSDVRME